MEQLTLSWFVNDAGAYVLAISAVPAEHLHRPLIVTVGDETLLNETTPAAGVPACAWCEEAEAPAYLAHEGHDPECPLQPPVAASTELRAADLAVGFTYAEPGLDPVTVTGLAAHGDTVLVTAFDGGRHALDRDTVVEVVSGPRRRRARTG